MRSFTLATAILLACVLCAIAPTISSAQALPLTTLVNFNGPNGNYPFWSVIQGSDGNFYGTTTEGGSVLSCNGVTAGCPCAPYGCGTIFKVTPTGTLTTLYNFCSLPGCADGYNPEGGLIQGSDGNFYGTTHGGGIFETEPGASAIGGTVFRITPTGVLTTFYSFCSEASTACFDGEEPTAGLVQGTDGNFYGTTIAGGTAGNGTVFMVSQTGNFEDTLYSFCSLPNCADGGSPAAKLLQASDGDFYSTTVQGGASNSGTIFKITPQGVLTTVHTFSGPDGAFPATELIQAKNGNFYGTAWVGGANSEGTVFEMNPGGAGAYLFSTLYSFCSLPNCADGRNIGAGLVQATDGNFYGSSFEGGANGDGTLFEITARGALTTLHSFDFTDGAQPTGTLIQASNGNFYGTTAVGGTGACASDPICGTVFTFPGPQPIVVIGVNPTHVNLGGTVMIAAQLTSCCTPKMVTLRFTLNGPLGPSCTTGSSVMFTTPPIPLPAKFSQSFSFPFRIPSSGICTGTYTVNSTTLVNGATMDSSTASLTITP